MQVELNTFNVLISSFLAFTFYTSNLNSQCLNSGGIGSFDSTSFQNSWNLSSNDYGNVQFMSNINQAYFGDSYMKAEVLSDSTSEVYISNKNDCNFSLVSGNPYTISFYLKVHLEKHLK